MSINIFAIVRDKFEFPTVIISVSSNILWSLLKLKALHLECALQCQTFNSDETLNLHIKLNYCSSKSSLLSLIMYFVRCFAWLVTDKLLLLLPLRKSWALERELHLATPLCVCWYTVHTVELDVFAWMSVCVCVCMRLFAYLCLCVCVHTFA